MIAAAKRGRRKPTASPDNSDPRCQPGACVKTPGNLRAFVVGPDPKDPDRVLIEYEVRSLGEDSYTPAMLALVCAAPEPYPESEPANTDELATTRRRRIESQSASIDAQLDETGGELDEVAPIEPTEITSVDSLSTIAAEISQLFGECEEAIEVASQAESAALQSAKLCGEKLLAAKKLVKHGQWEKWRANIRHPKTGKPMPSSTATLYQRVFERWEELQAASSLREAATLLKSDRAPAKSATIGAGVAETPNITLEPRPIDYFKPFPEPKPVWFLSNEEVVEGQAIAQNHSQTALRVVYGENQELQLPVGKAVWEPPVTSKSETAIAPTPLPANQIQPLNPVSDEVERFQQRKREQLAEMAIAQLGPEAVALMAMAQCDEAALQRLGDWILDRT